MAIVLKDRVKVSSGTTGTGTITLGAAASGFQDFAAIGTGNQTYYTVALQSGSEWEVGIGTVTDTAGTFTLSRDTVFESSNAGSLVNFSAGTKDVFVTYPAERAVYLDAAGSAVTVLDIGTLGTSTANITTANITSGTVSTAPVNNTDIVNKQYADAIASGIHFHEAVDLATTAALPANTYNNGTSGVGATLTANANGALSVDSTLTVVGNRILVKNQAAGLQNGVYTVTQVGSAGTPYILTRATDFDSVGTGVDQIDEGDFFLVTSGTANVNTAWVQQTSPPITIGTTALVFQQFSAPITYTAGTGLSESPTYTFNIANTGTAGTYGSASQVPVFATNAQGQVTSATNTAIAIAAAAVSGLAASATTDTTNAANITSGTLPVARLNGSYTGITGTGALAAGSLAAGFTAVSAPIGGTGQSSYTVGDLLYANTATSLAKLADVVAGNALISGGVGTAPAWGKIGAATHISGTLPVANGGTGVTSSTGTGSVVLSNSPTLVTPALGTPSSGTVTNLTGTASININGTVGATTPSTGNFTTVDVTTLDVTNINAKDGTASMTLADSTGIATFSKATVVSTTDNTNAALRITQLGTGNALLVEDSTNPDASPFVIDNGGTVISGYTTSVVTAGSGSAPRVQVHGLGGGAATAGATSWSTGIDVGPSFVLSRSEGGVIGTQTIVDTNDVLGNLRFAGSDGTAFIEAAKITASVDGTPGLNDMPGRLVFSTTADGAATPTERMRIGADGGVGIGASNAAGYKLLVAGTISGATNSFGIASQSQIQSDVTGSFRVFRSSPSTAAAAFTLVNLRHFEANQGAIGAGSSVTSQVGFFADAGLVGATNNYGFYGNIPAAAGRYNFYAAGTADNYFAGQVQLGAGTAAAPALSTTGDTNTGIFFPAADTIAFSEGGAEAMRIDSSGNVGIGTSSPGTKLDVSGNLRFSAASPVIEFNNGGAQVYSTVANTLQFASGGSIGSPTERMRITSTGAIAFNGAANYGTSGQVLTSSGNGPPTWAAAAGGGVTSITGTASQVTASASTGAVTLSLPSTINVNTSGNAATATNCNSANAKWVSAAIAGSQGANVSAVEIRNAGGSGDSNLANITFHCTGAYGISLHLRPDGYFGLGGWSSSSWRWYSAPDGTMVAGGNVVAYSDERLKKNWRSLSTDIVDQLAEVKSGIYDRIDVDGLTQVGVSAQSLQKVMPNAVVMGLNDTLTVAYGNAALVSAVELAKRVVEQDARIAKLEAIVAQLTKGNIP